MEMDHPWIFSHNTPPKEAFFYANQNLKTMNDEIIKRFNIIIQRKIFN